MLEKSTIEKINQRKKRRVKKKTIFWMIIMVVAAFGLWYQQNHSLHVTTSFQSQVVEENKELTTLLTYDPLDQSSFGVYEKDMIQCTKDGVKRITLDGHTVWSQAYFMNRPSLIVSNPYVGVGDIGGQQIYAFGDKGKAYIVETSYPILQFTLTQKGFLGVLQQTPTGHQISVYDNQGKILVDHITYAEKDGQPLGIFLSPEGEQLVTSYVDTNGNEILSKLTFFNIGEIGEGQIDSISGSYHYPNLLIPQGTFLDDHTFIAIGDQKILSFQVNKKPIESWSYLYSQKVRKVSMKGKKSFALAFGDPLAGAHEENGEIARIYDQQGKVLGEQQIKAPVDYLYHTDNITIVGTGRTFYGMNTKGKILWEYTATKDIKAFLPFSDYKNFLIVSQEDVTFMQLK